MLVLNHRQDHRKNDSNRRTWPTKIKFIDGLSVPKDSQSRLKFLLLEGGRHTAN